GGTPPARRLAPSSCGAPRSPAATAGPTSATCSRTAHARRACATASTRRRSPLRRETLLTLRSRLSPGRVVGYAVRRTFGHPEEVCDGPRKAARFFVAPRKEPSP